MTQRREHAPGAYCSAIHGRVFSSPTPLLLDEWLGEVYGIRRTPLEGSCAPGVSWYEAYWPDSESGVRMSGVYQGERLVKER